MTKRKANYCPECGASDDTVSPGIAALLRDCRDLISLAHKAAEIEAFPGPAWRLRAKEMVRLIDSVKGVDK